MNIEYVCFDQQITSYEHLADGIVTGARSEVVVLVAWIKIIIIVVITKNVSGNDINRSKIT